MKSKALYIIIILFLASTNIATIISISARKKSADQTEELSPGRLPMESRMSFFWSELGLDEEQRSDAIKYNTDYNSKASSITNELKGLRHKIVEEMASQEPDREELNEIIEKFGKGHSELKRETVDFYYQLYSLCDSGQRTRLEFMFRDMLDPDGRIYGRGRGGQGRDRQFYNGGRRTGQDQSRGVGRGRGRNVNR